MRMLGRVKNMTGKYEMARRVIDKNWEIYV
jgi:hypothetical protein